MISFGSKNPLKFVVDIVCIETYSVITKVKNVVVMMTPGLPDYHIYEIFVIVNRPEKTLIQFG